MQILLTSFWILNQDPYFFIRIHNIRKNLEVFCLEAKVIRIKISKPIQYTSLTWLGCTYIVQLSIGQMVWPGLGVQLSIRQMVWPGLGVQLSIGHMAWPGLGVQLSIGQMVWPGLGVQLSIRQLVWPGLGVQLSSSVCHLSMRRLTSMALLLTLS